jgi:hypothetical protein
MEDDEEITYRYLPSISIDGIFSYVKDGDFRVFKGCSKQVNILTDRDSKGNNYLHRYRIKS